ncbi:hypothetical protein [Streptomyces boluensis]|nr:hypothetical protein [Streptomyces boluensis]
MRTARPRTLHPLLWAASAALALGAALCVLGWYGISGERFTARQVPYLASCTLPGAALLVAGAVLLVGGRHALATARVEQLYALLVAADPGAPEADAGVHAPVASSADLLQVPGGTLYHRADCPLVVGKPAAVPADPDGGGLTPCPVCEPGPPDDAPDDRTPPDRAPDDSSPDEAAPES